jgi:hypothetical protein
MGLDVIEGRSHPIRRHSAIIVRHENRVPTRGRQPDVHCPCDAATVATEAADGGAEVLKQFGDAGVTALIDHDYLVGSGIAGEHRAQALLK